MVRDGSGMGWLGRTILLVAIVVVFWGAVYPSVLAPNVPAPYVAPFAEKNDYVEVDYRGWFPSTGKTFDTSIRAVANDNATYPKAPSFSYRPGAGSYRPLPFIIGCVSNATNQGCPIPAFQDAVKGLHAGEAHVVYIPPEKAYGLSDATKIHIRPLLEEVTATETMNSTQFQAQFGTSPVDGSIVTDPAWGWTSTVRVAGAVVTVRAAPTLNKIVRIAGEWNAEVVWIDDAANQGLGVVRVRHHLLAADVDAFVATDRTGNFIIVALDAAAGTFTVDYNNAVVGKTLAFELTVTTLRKAKP